jgi:hypothetical protein
MTPAFSNDLRERVVAAVSSGESWRAVAARYDVAVSSVVPTENPIRHEIPCGLPNHGVIHRHAVPD